jgi:hypothetical protein
LVVFETKFVVPWDRTTVLHSLRRMENRAARDPDLRVYMTSVRQMFPSHRPSTGH